MTGLLWLMGTPDRVDHLEALDIGDGVADHIAEPMRVRDGSF